MKIFTKSVLINTALIFGLSAGAMAQTSLSGFMQGKTGGSLSFSGTSEKYKSVYLFPDEIDETPIFKEVVTNSFNIYGVYGFTDKLDFIVNLPIVQTAGSANQEVLNGLGYTNSKSGAQDISAFLKYEFAKKANLSLQGSLGFSTPVGDYKVDEGLQSIIAIGNRATTVNGLVLGHLTLDRGLFLTGQVGYSFRTTDVPDAVVSQLKFGYAASRVYMDGYISNQTSTGGVDILRNGFTGFFPATKVNYTRIGGSIYAPIDGNIGISGGGGAIIKGRNVGKSSYFTFGVTYQFKYRQI